MSEEKLKQVISVCGGLSRGEWDRSLVDRGGLPYKALFDVPLALYRYCATLDLDSRNMEFVRVQIRRYRRSRECHNAEAAPSNPYQSPNSDDLPKLQP